MNLPKADWQRKPGMKRLLAALDAGGGQTRYVGGCVRDAMLGLPVSDVDLATRMEPEEVMGRLQRARIKVVPTGISHGTVTAVVGGAPIEVTTLRRDVATDGRRATVAFTEDWQADAARRDFTFNALSADPVTGEIFDYFDGIGDLTGGRVRFIGDPLQRIAEDHLRILRFFRFHARFGKGEPDPAALASCTARANDLMALSRERLADELLKLLALPNPAATVSMMVETGILRPVLPEIDAAGAAALAKLETFERGLDIGPDPIRRLAALLPPDPELAGTIAARLRLSNKQRRRLETAADRLGSVPDDPRPLAYRIGGDEALDQLLLGPDDAARDEKASVLKSWSRPRFPLRGSDLIAMGLSAGPIVAATLQAVEREWALQGFPDDSAVVRRLARRHVDQLLRSSQ
jgi:poly(A) polymerase